MKVETLEAYNVPADVIELWRREIGPELLPVQERAVKEFGLFGADNLIVFSPTSSGKAETPRAVTGCLPPASTRVPVVRSVWPRATSRSTARSRTPSDPGGVSADGDSPGPMTKPQNQNAHRA